MKKSFNILLMAGMLFSISEISGSDSEKAVSEQATRALWWNEKSGANEARYGSGGGGGGTFGHSNVPDYQDDGEFSPVEASSFGLKRVGIGAAGLFGTFLLGTGIVNDQTKTAAAGAFLLGSTFAYCTPSVNSALKDAELKYTKNAYRGACKERDAHKEQCALFAWAFNNPLDSKNDFIFPKKYHDAARKLALSQEIKDMPFYTALQKSEITTEEINALVERNR